MVIYRYKRWITRSGRVIQKRVRLRMKKIPRRINRTPPYLREEELVAKLLEQKKKLDIVEAEKRKRYRHEQLLRRLEEKREKTIFKCYCTLCRKMRIVKDPEFKILNPNDRIKSLTVKGKCIKCGRPTIYTLVKKAEQDEIDAMEGVELPKKNVKKKMDQT